MSCLPCCNIEVPVSIIDKLIENPFFNPDISDARPTETSPHDSAVMLQVVSVGVPKTSPYDSAVMVQGVSVGLLSWALMIA